MRFRRGQRGFTLLETLIALSGLAVIGLAIAAMVAASGQAWASRADHEAQARDFRVFSARLHEWLRGARRVAAVHETGGDVEIVVWLNDDHQAGAVNLAELMLMRFDDRAGTVDVHLAEVRPGALDSPIANPAFAGSVVASRAFPPLFRNRGDVERYRVAENIEAFTASAATSSSGPAFDYLELMITAEGEGATPARLTAVGARLRAPDTTVTFTEPPDAGVDDDAAEEEGGGDAGRGRGRGREDDDDDEDDEDDDRGRDRDDDDDDDEGRGRGRDRDDDDDRGRGRDRDDDDDDDRGRGRDRDRDDDDDDRGRGHDDDDDDDDDRGRGRGRGGDDDDDDRGGPPSWAPGGSPFD